MCFANIFLRMTSAGFRGNRRMSFANKMRMTSLGFYVKLNAREIQYLTSKMYWFPWKPADVEVLIVMGSHTLRQTGGASGSRMWVADQLGAGVGWMNSAFLYLPFHSKLNRP